MNLFGSLLASFLVHQVSSFMVASHSSSVSCLMALPSVHQVSTDAFMKQLGHASQIIPLLHPQEDGKTLSDDETSALSAVLSRQFSHSDGIRGFFAVYLTSPESLTVEDVPAILAEAVKNSDKKVMVPLACMNVIMPTAMSSIHEDAELKECASKTAVNGMKILRLLKDDDYVIMNCKAIMSVCRGTGEGAEDMIEYWNRFFVNYKYADKQKEDIALMVAEFC
ncbi:hypothetical protein ACHAXA_005675 [Cyclostephanos tholiformis]|uniref:Uncharacterized protein n=1 Tax=Cyclostephanos tholiformis TaxID=382380 RepID=A0ABD3SRD7_9STRA